MLSLRAWATPLTIGSFLIMGVTGTLMFFHIDSGLNKLVHEWAGWAMLIGVGAHLVLNWRAFTCYFKRPLPLAIMVAGGVILGASFLQVGGGTTGNPFMLAVDAVQQAPLSEVVALSDRPMADVLAQLQDAGFDATPDAAIAALSQGDRAVQADLLQMIFTQ